MYQVAVNYISALETIITFLEQINEIIEKKIPLFSYVLKALIQKISLLEEKLIGNHSRYIKLYLISQSKLAASCYHMETFSLRIRSYSGPYFPAFGLNVERY